MLKLSRNKTPISGRIKLDGSKSISNRVLILQALGGQDFPISGLSTSQDSTTMLQLLEQYRQGDFDQPFDAGAAGTTFRFLTAFLAIQPGTQIMTGSDRMKQRPIGPLVEALNTLGADIRYLEKAGYPPLQVGVFSSSNRSLTGKGVNHLQIEAGMSSQYISALLMLGAFLQDGLKLELIGDIVSRPYIQMTLSQMAYLGIQSSWEENIIEVPNQKIWARPFEVEADWSAASYHYALVAFAKKGELYLDGLFSDSFQGDSVIAKIMTVFGVETEFTETGVRIFKTERVLGPSFEWDFLECPDLAQTVAVVCGALGITGRFTGLQTLRIKETDRILALQKELAKVNIEMVTADVAERFFEISSPFYNHETTWNNLPQFHTYEDHRMAMAFAPLAIFAPVIIEDPTVVRKSYPAFWDDLSLLGFKPEVLS